MAQLSIPLVFTVFAIVMGWAVLAEEAASGIREPRSHRKRLCRKYGICNQGGHGGFQGGHGGYGEYQGGYQGGYQGHQGNYQGGYGGLPPINIGISQSQSSANAGGGGYGHGSYPNNYQYNNHGGYSGYEGFGGHHGGYQRPGYNNGLGSYNNQFNGNYYGGNGGGYGFQGPSGNGFYDEGGNVEHEEETPHAADEGNYAASGSFAFAGRSSKGSKA